MTSLAELHSLLPDSSVARRLLPNLKEVPGPPGMGPCLIWTRQGSMRTGYGRIRVATGVWAEAHVWVHEQLHGPVPPGQEVHHTCHEAALDIEPGCVGGDTCPHRPCVIHTVATTHRDNLLRGATLAAKQVKQTHCNGKYSPRDLLTGEVIGHDLTDPDNVYRHPKFPNIRDCRPCRNERKKAYDERQAALRARTGAVQLVLVEP